MKLWIFVVSALLVGVFVQPSKAFDKEVEDLRKDLIKVADDIIETANKAQENLKKVEESVSKLLEELRKVDLCLVPSPFLA